MAKAPSQSRVRIRVARTADVPALLAMMVDFNRHEKIAWRPRTIERALRALLADRGIGLVMVAEQARVPIAYTVVSYGYDLEFAGRDAFVTELFVSAPHRQQGIARRLLSTLLARVRKEHVHALHLVVRPENRKARALYADLGFARVPRLIMTKLLPRSASRRSGSAKM